MRSRNLTLPTCWLLLATCHFQRCLALRHSYESLTKTLNQFAKSYRNIALLLPLELTLQIRDPVLQDYSATVDLLLSKMNRRREVIQKFYFHEVSAVGFQVSKSRRIMVNSGNLTLYYYAAYVGTNRMERLTNFLRDFCNREPRKNYQCRELVALSNVVRYSLLQLATFKYLRSDIGELSDMFTDFTDGTSASNRKFLVAQNSDAHDVHQLLCKELMQCGINRCNLSRIQVPKSEFDRFQWDGYNEVMNKSHYSAKVTDNQPNLFVNLSLQMVLKESLGANREDFGVYRSWCEKLGLRCASVSSVTLLACAAVLLLR